MVYHGNYFKLLPNFGNKFFQIFMQIILNNIQSPSLAPSQLDKALLQTLEL